jgi:hypothetical protein
VDCESIEEALANLTVNGNDSSESDKGKSKGLLDSGATHALSRIKSDFSHIREVKSVRLKVANGAVSGGKAVASLGRFKPNSLFISRAVYFPVLPMDRIFATPVLNDAKWEVHFYPTYAVLVHQPTGAVIPTEKVAGGLHEIPIEFREESQNLGSENGFSENLLVSAQVPPTCSACGGVWCTSAHVSVLMRHRRLGHFHDKSLARKIECPECMEAKGKKTNLGKSSTLVLKLNDMFQTTLTTLF